MFVLGHANIHQIYVVRRFIVFVALSSFSQHPTMGLPLGPPPKKPQTCVSWRGRSVAFAVTPL